jgi:predicted enzyme related to lactoylglutathione lyase
MIQYLTKPPGTLPAKRMGGWSLIFTRHNQCDFMEKPEGKVTGIGGIFFKCQDPESLRAWYATHLGMKVDEYGSLFETRSVDPPHARNFIQWSTFSKESAYMEPSQRAFMINYRVVNLEALLAQLEAAGVTLIGEVIHYDYGSFAHVMDPEGNKLELWEPVDQPFADQYGPDETTH